MGYVANEAQSDASQQGIVLVMSLIPGVIALLAAYVMRFYNLTDDVLEKVQEDLNQRKSSV